MDKKLLSKIFTKIKDFKKNIVEHKEEIIAGAITTVALGVASYAFGYYIVGKASLLLSAALSISIFKNHGVAIL